MTYSDQRERLFGKPSVSFTHCPFCGRIATNKHHIIPKGMGGTKRERDIPTITVCGQGNTSGCHGKLHDHTLKIDWDDEANWWRYRYSLAYDSHWKPLPKKDLFER